jgi:hypothetical protein
MYSSLRASAPRTMVDESWHGALGLRHVAGGASVAVTISSSDGRITQAYTID